MTVKNLNKKGILHHLVPQTSTIFATMSLPLRITYNGQDYSYVILTKKIESDTQEIKIALNGEELTISRNTLGEWDVLERTINDEQGLLKEIARNVALRYRLR